MDCKIQEWTLFGDASVCIGVVVVTTLLPPFLSISGPRSVEQIYLDTQ